MLTLKQRIPLPPRAHTMAVALPRAAQAVREMKTASFVVVKDEAEIARLKAELKAAQAALKTAANAAAARAHREERLKAITIRVVDRRDAWAAKMGLKQRAPFVAITSERIVTADVWQLPTPDE